MDDYQEFRAYRQYQDQIIQELRRPRHFNYLKINAGAADKQAIKDRCRQVIDRFSGPELPEIRQRLYRDVPGIITDYVKYSLEQDLNSND